MTSKTHPEVPFEAYRGTAPYAFVSYAHDDAARVYPELERMRGYGFNLWYDEGISPGHDWPEELAAAIEGCALFLLFVSPRSVGSDNCNRETTFALGKERPFLAVHLEPTTLPRGLELSIGNSQAVLKHRMQPDAYEKKLVEALAASLGTSGTSDTSEQKPALAPVGQPTAGATTETRSYVRAFTALGALVLIGGAIAGYQYFSTLTTERWITETAIPAIQRDLEQGRVLAAYAMTRAIEDANPEDSSLQRLWPTVAVRGSVLSAPSGAIVSVRPLASDAGAWTILGTTPLEQFPLPNGNNFWRLEAGDDRTRTFFRGNYSGWFGTSRRARHQP